MKRLAAVASAFAVVGAFAPAASADKQNGCRGVLNAFSQTQAQGVANMPPEVAAKLWTRYVQACVTA